MLLTTLTRKKNKSCQNGNDNDYTDKNHERKKMEKDNKSRSIDSHDKDNEYGKSNNNNYIKEN